MIVMPQPRGQITLPKKFRDKYGIKPGTPVKVTDEGTGVKVEPVRILSYPVRSYTDQEVDEFLALDKKETAELKKLGILK